MREYYFHDGSQQKGPYTYEELQSFNINANTMVWYEGLDSWTEAKNLSELKLKPTPPPLIQKKIPPPLEKSNPIVQTEQKRSYLSFSLKLISAVFAFVIVVFVLQKIASSSSSSYRGSNNTNSTESQTIYNEATVSTNNNDNKRMSEQDIFLRDNIYELLNPHTNSYKKDVIMGGISDLVIKMDNPTPYTLEKVEVYVYYIKADGSTHKVETVYFKNIPPNKRVIESAPNSNKGMDVRCQVVRVTCRKLGLS